MDEKRYFSVECKCGHTGSRAYYIPIKFAVIAENAKEAAKIGRWMPRSKHHHKDCVLSVLELSYEEYIELCDSNDNDPYLKCHSIQEQRMFDLSDRFVLDECYLNDETEREPQLHQTFFGKQKIKNPKRFIKNY